jgi:hypothetical protein
VYAELPDVEERAQCEIGNAKRRRADPMARSWIPFSP